MKQTILSPDQVKNKEYEHFNPERYDFFFRPDGSCLVVELSWWDDASYARYQGDQEE